MKVINNIRLLFVLLLFIAAACVQPSNNTNSEKDSMREKENALLKKELELKEKELELEQSKNATKKEIPISELYKQMKQGVFIIYTQGSDYIAQGTGFFLNSNGVAISNYHVFENADKAIVILDNQEKYLINKIISYNRELDYVIFQVANQSSCYSLHLSNAMPDIGSTCFAIGNPQGLTQTLSIGNVSGYRDDNKLIQTTTEITHGSSGGPLFNSSGEVVGITSSGLGEANLNFALNISKVPHEEYTSSISSSHSLSETTTEIEPVLTSEIKSTIQTYYTTLFDKNYLKLSLLYSPNIDRFFSEFNITSTAAVEKAKNYWKMFKAISANNKVDWTTLKITPVSSETYYVTFNMDYYLTKASGKVQTYNIDIIMTITSDMKVKSIYENIIHFN